MRRDSLAPRRAAGRVRAGTSGPWRGAGDGDPGGGGRQADRLAGLDGRRLNLAHGGVERTRPGRIEHRRNRRTPGVARFLGRFARELGCETIVVDGRAAFATPARFPNVDRLIVGWPDEVAEQIGLGPRGAAAVLPPD